METVGGLLLVLIGVSHGVDFSCDGRQDGAQCYGALGGAVIIQLMDDALTIPRFIWKKNNTILFRWKYNKIVFNNIGNRSLFNDNSGTARTNNLNKGDSGEYELEIYNSNGKQTGKRTLQLSVQTPVSSVQLVPQCLSQGQMKVSCSSEEGDSPQYSWTLDGHTLTDSELLSGNNETNIIVLRQNISGRLSCSVRNHVSNESKDTQISTCGFILINCTSNGTYILKWVFKENNTLCVEPTVSAVEQWSVMAGVPSALVLFVIVLFAIACGRRKQTYRVRENDHEPIYADIGIVQQQERQEEQSVKEEEPDVEVEYRQVKVSKPPCQSISAVEDLYAKICKDR
ncbi:T-cell surface antigen CD2-like isoform X2 [Kryptolebias marmoratus]|uniref:T-cell surface antigen CD2-like isoform X2 n=1 Tax=Kryptolebias marmoratus TaxID=37003 RepID=UPI0007F93AEC|nr:T-cell surface antigen CD2-like isoform X2 [Kryptolebias marmoratus]